MQRSDLTIAQLTHKRKTLPELARLAELDTKIADLDRQRIDLATRVADLARQQRQVDGEVEMVKARRERDEQRMSSGAVSPKDLTALQHELEALQRRIGALEDDELEVMELLESAQGELDVVQQQGASIAEERAKAQSSLSEVVGAIDADLAAARSARDGAATLVTTDLLALYDKIAGSHNGVGAAELKGASCQGCRLDITGADLREVQAAAADEIVRCPECGRILIRTSV